MGTDLSQVRPLKPRTQHNDTRRNQPTAGESIAARLFAFLLALSRRPNTDWLGSQRSDDRTTNCYESEHSQASRRSRARNHQRDNTQQLERQQHNERHHTLAYCNRLPAARNLRKRPAAPLDGLNLDRQPDGRSANYLRRNFLPADSTLRGAYLDHITRLGVWPSRPDNEMTL